MVNSTGAVSTNNTTLGIGTYTISGDQPTTPTETQGPGAIPLLSLLRLFNHESAILRIRSHPLPALASRRNWPCRTMSGQSALSRRSWTSGPIGATTGTQVSSSGMVHCNRNAKGTATYSAWGSEHRCLRRHRGVVLHPDRLCRRDHPTGPLRELGGRCSLRHELELHRSVENHSSSSKVTFTVTSSSPPGLVVSTAGLISAKGALAAGTYTVSGTDSDGLGDHGSWGFSATVIPTKITETGPG